MYDELMTATSLGATKGFSALTFAALKDMGWYTVDDSFNETTNYGYQKNANTQNNLFDQEEAGRLATLRWFSCCSLVARMKVSILIL